MKFRNFLLRTSALAWAPPSLCFSDSGGAGTGASGGAAGGTGGGGAGDAGGAAAFLAQIPEEIRGEAAFKDIKDVPNLARSYLNGQKLLGVPQDQLIRLAGPDDAEAWNGIWGKLGRPEKPDLYQLGDPPAELIPAGLKFSPEAKAKFAATAHGLGLTQKQADQLYRDFNAGRIEAATAVHAAEQAALGEVNAALKSAFGDAFDRAQEDGNAALDHLDASLKLRGRLTGAFKELPAAAREPLFRAFAQIGRGMREDGTLTGRGSGNLSGALSPAEANQQINTLRGDAEFNKAYNDRAAPGHADAVARMTRLYEQAYPRQTAA